MRIFTFELYNLFCIFVLFLHYTLFLIKKVLNIIFKKMFKLVILGES